MDIKDIYYKAHKCDIKIHAKIWKDTSSEKTEAVAQQVVVQRAVIQRAVIQLAHGMCEYVERYDEFARCLAKAGYIVVANDHRGHGASVDNKTIVHGYFGEKDGYKHMIEDMHSLHKLMKKEYPDLPYILLGHSMGSFLSRLYAEKYGTELDALILSGTGNAPPSVPFGRVMGKVITSMIDPRKPGILFYAMSAGAFNKRFKPARTGSEWLTRDEKKVDEFLAAEASRFTFSYAGYMDLFEMMRLISRKEWAKGIPKALPILFVSGDMDPVGNYGKDIPIIANRLRGAGCNDVTVKLYKDGRHEMLNEINRKEVFEDILDWISGIVE